MVVLSTRYNLIMDTHPDGIDKRAEGGVVWGWVTDREVWLRLKFDQRLSVTSVKNILIERLTSQTIWRFKKNWKKNWEKFQTFFEKIINYADGLRRGQSRRHRLRRGQ
jgi:hypothetical protein